MKKRSVLLLVLVLALALPIVSASASTHYYISGTSFLKIRELPDSGARVKDSYRADYAVASYKKYNADWAYVSFSNGESGYVMRRYLKASKSYTGYITKNDTALRTGPAASFSESASLAQGTKVTVLTSGSAWSYISTGKGTGYVKKSLISTKPVKKNPYPYTAYVQNPAGRTVNVRKGAGKNYAVLTELDIGQPVTVIGVSGRWYHISDPTSGWMLGVYLTRTAPSGKSSSSSSSSSSAVRYITSPNGKSVNVRRGPSEKGYGVMISLPVGTKVERISSTDSGWTKISYSGMKGDGYVKTEYLTTKKPAAEPTPKSGSSSSSTSSKTRYITSPDGKSVNVRRGPSTTAYAVMISLKVGTKVELLSSSGGWSKIDYSGMKGTGYVKDEYLTATKPGTTPAPTPKPTPDPDGFKSFKATVFSGEGRYVNLRADAGTAYSTVTQILSGTRVKVIGEKGDWYKISYNGMEGYMMKKYVIE